MNDDAPYYMEIKEIAHFQHQKRATIKKVLESIVRTELIMHTPKWANTIVFSFRDNKIVIGARDSYRGTELSLMVFLKPPTLYMLNSERHVFADSGLGDMYFFKLDELYTHYEQEYEEVSEFAPSDEDVE